MIRKFFLIVFSITLFLAALLALALKLDLAFAWLAAVNAMAFLTYGYDKLVAGTGRLRVPERVLIWLAFTGGAPAAYLGMRLFHHKTSKATFQRAFWLVTLGQAVVIAIYVYFTYIIPNLKPG